MALVLFTVGGTAHAGSPITAMVWNTDFILGSGETWAAIWSTCLSSPIQARSSCSVNVTHDVSGVRCSGAARFFS